ncbi:HisA/HisF-related TIM barrel protein [Herbaspirillum seropedicae]|uniref:HisA/HisF-related TIM barrel protein n=1 Tax=Herbaspirillum seropedicae TaxID=964 RepID=UPI000848320E|nr:HisA/HisF-related TIM barrel protein [Herbaspirillum seropedicae]AON56549.1 Imidazole glycerol phosphate synthase cyclase subunit [Herbaspirillum seropedicae]MDR6395969.1 cyclase [Herbaspirillum seropedicae]
MLKKRLIGVVTVKDGWAVQSFGYRRYLPLGKPQWIVENLDRWGADEILVLCMDRSARQAGPDFALLESLASMGLGTPLIYGGGIASAEDGVKVIQAGADRISIDALLHDAPQVLIELGYQLGVQALIAAVPMRMHNQMPCWHDYRHRRDLPLAALEKVLGRGLASELLVIDCEHEGRAASFDTHLLDALPDWNMPLLAFGGISEASQMEELLARPRVAAVGVGNFLSYRELAIQQYKKVLASPALRPALYATDFPH